MIWNIFIYILNIFVSFALVFLVLSFFSEKRKRSRSKSLCIKVVLTLLLYFICFEKKYNDGCHMGLHESIKLPETTNITETQQQQQQLKRCKQQCCKKVILCTSVIGSSLSSFYLYTSFSFFLSLPSAFHHFHVWFVFRME
jgi:hypothetical protein